MSYPIDSVAALRSRQVKGREDLFGQERGPVFHPLGCYLERATSLCTTAELIGAPK